MKHKLLLLTIAIFAGISATFSQNEWPREITSSDGSKLTVYEPQPESLSGNEMTGRAAVAYRKTATSEPVFGAILFNATVQNTGSGNINVQSFNVTRAKFSGMEDQQQVENFTTKLEEEAPDWNWGMTKAEVEEAVAHEQGTTEAAKFNNAPPKIIYADKPSALVVIDGDPKVSRDKNLDADKVVNSPNLIFKENGQWNLYSGGNWYRSTGITSGWRQNTNLSAKVKSVNEQVKKQEKENNNGKELETDPKLTDIIVTTEPAELIQTNGEPEYKNVAGTSLLYVANSPNEIFKDINSQKTYILIAGRWYRSSNMNGPWEYVPADRLPDDFAKIPDGSDKDQVLASVAGTDAAENARVNAYVPQTAKVDRRTATIDVQYDGEPYFTRIQGTSLRLAENANVTVVQEASGNYFALDNGVWFISDDPYGPWAVANDRPRDIENIPASSPAYNSRYVYVYDVTPDYVYMGYTSGYLGSYFYGPTIVYGTGWHYRPWYRTYYYPRPWTWGFGFIYDPWYGWNFNWGYNYGFLHVGFAWGGVGYYGYGYGGGWWGPSRYCPPYRRHYYWNNGYYYRDRNYYGYNRNYDRRPLYGSAGRPQRNVSNYGVRPSRNYNLYNNQQGVTTRDIQRTARVYRPANAVVNNNNPRPSRERFGRELTPVQNDNNNDGDRRLRRNENPREPILNNPAERNNNNNNNNNAPERRDNNNNSRELPRVYRPEQQESNNAPRELPRASRPEPRQNNNNSQRELPRVSRPEPRQQSAPRELPRVSRPEPSRSSAPRELPRVSSPQPRSSSPSPAPRVDPPRGRRPDRR
ncbi:MAG: hypothetical protein JNK79_15990 [Chitinophagaceae bacterium]|nr:hypothetical protein [Chitinophagaceae bacterium]